MWEDSCGLVALSASQMVFPHLFLSVFFVAEPLRALVPVPVITIPSPSILYPKNQYMMVWVHLNRFVFWKLNDFFACFCFGGQKDEKSGLKPKKSQDVGAAGVRLKSAQSVSRAIVKRQAVWQVFLRLLHGMWTSLVPSMYQSCCPCCPTAFATANMVEHLRLPGRGQVPSPVVKVKASTFHWENLCRWCHLLESTWDPMISSCTMQAFAFFIPRNGGWMISNLERPGRHDE